MVMAGEFAYGTTGAGLAHGFRREGWAVHEVELRQFFPRLGERWARAVLRPMRRLLTESYNAAVLEAVRQTQPQLFMSLKGSGLTPDMLDELGRRGVARAIVYPDYHFEYPDVDPATLERFDLFVTTKSFQVEALRARLGPHRVAFVHHGYCDLTHVPSPAEASPGAPLADVLYVGNYAAEKERWLAAIARRLPQVRLRIVGFRWQVARDPVLAPCVQGHGLVGDLYTRAVQSAGVNIAVHGDRKEPEGWQDLVSTRTFEIPACKGFMLHVDNAEVRGLFDAGREIDVFAGETELIDKICYYLARPELRRAMAERAHARCVPAYGYAARAAEITRAITRGLDLRDAGLSPEAALWPARAHLG